MVIGKITSIGSLFIIGAIAILFLKQASATSFGHAGQDVGSGITGISTGISNLFSSFINPITGLFGSIQSLFNWNESDARATNTYGYVRPEPYPATSRQGSVSQVTNTTTNVSGYVASASDTGGGTISSGNFGGSDTSSGWGL